jgi:hypothetical protein
MTDKELARQAIALLESSWEYVHSTALNKQIRWFLSAVKSRCQRCGKVSPAEIHTCSPQKQEPVAWLDSLDRSQPHAVTGFQYLTVSQIERGEQHKYIPVYAAPQQREWKGLTENEKELLWDEAVDGREHFCSQYGDFADTIEAKLKEKNT